MLDLECRVALEDAHDLLNMVSLCPRGFTLQPQLSLVHLRLGQNLIDVGSIELRQDVHSLIHISLDSVSTRFALTE